MSKNVEGAAADNMANAGNFQNIGIGYMIQKAFSGGDRKVGTLKAKGEAKAARGGTTAEDFANQELAKRYDYERSSAASKQSHGQAKDMIEHNYKTSTTYGAKGRTIKNISGDASGKFSHSYEDVAAPVSAKPEGKSTVVKGKQFDKPMPTFSVPGPNGRRVSNPEYGKWKSELNSVNASTTAGNASPLGIPKNPGQAPRAPRGSKA